MIVLQSQRTSDYIPLKLKKPLRFVNSLHSDMFIVSFRHICSMSFSLYFLFTFNKVGHIVIMYTLCTRLYQNGEKEFVGHVYLLKTVYSQY